MLEVSMRSVIAFAIAASAALLTGCTDQVGVTCPPGQTLCGETCVYTSSDPHNCGSCGNDCGDLVCIGGVCGCPKGQTACNGECVNTTSDVANCGACGTACPMPQVCSMGMCSGSCAAGLTNCNRDCVDLTSDDKNCGMCGAACASGSHCQGGACVQECPAGQVVCNGKCASLSSDNGNCGACGNVCPDQYFCIFGSCILGCPRPLTRCVPDGGESDGGSQCIDTRFDPSNCGGCGGSDVSPAPIPSQPPTRPHVCTATDGFNDDPVCDNGRCSWTCIEGAIQCESFQPLRGGGGTRLSNPTPKGGPQPAPNEPGIEQQCFLTFNDNCNCGGCDIICNPGNNERGPSRGPLARAPQPRPFEQDPRGDYRISTDQNGLLQCFDEEDGYPEPQQCCNSQCMDVGTNNSCGNCAGVSDCSVVFPSPGMNGTCCAKKPNINDDPGLSQDNNCRDLNNDFHACGDCLNDCAITPSAPPAGPSGPSGPPASVPPAFDTCCDGECATIAVSVTNCGNGCGTGYNDCTQLFPSPSSTPACCQGVQPSIPPMGYGCFDVTEIGNFSDQTHIHNCGACGTDCTVTNPCPSNNPNTICRSGVCDCTGS
jgi:Stigma-specific protein, Stig1